MDISKETRKLCSTCKWKHYTDICEHPDLRDKHGKSRASARFTRSKKGPCSNGEMWVKSK